MEPGTPESRLLSRHPGVRELVGSLPEFLQWRGRLAKVEVDGEEFRVIGDRLLDEDQLIVEWARLFRPELVGGE